MPVSLGANGGSYNYPQENDPAGWGDDATNWASAVSAALSNIGLGGTASADAVVNIISTTKGILIPRMTTTQRNAIGSPSTSLLIYNTTTTQYELYTGSTWQSLASYISGTLTVTGAASLQSTLAVNGNTTLGDDSGDTLTITGNVVSTPNGLNIDSNTLVVDATNNRVGVVTASPTVALDVTGDIKASSTIQSANGTATAPGITFSGDTNTGIYNIAADTIGFSANGAESARIDSQGIELIDGTAAAPSISFSSDTNTGLYRIGADVIGVATNGTRVGQIGVGYGGFTGNVIQTVFGSVATNTNNTTTTFADSGLSATITPRYSNSDILVMGALQGVFNNTASQGVKVRIVRGSTQIMYVCDLMGYEPARSQEVSFFYIDSPSTTSATTYKIQFAEYGGGGLAVIMDYGSTIPLSTIVLMEIQK